MKLKKMNINQISWEYLLKGIDWFEEPGSQEEFEILLIKFYDFSAGQAEEFVTDLLNQNFDSKIGKKIAFSLLLQIKKQEEGIIIDKDFYSDVEDEAEEIEMDNNNLLYLYKKIIKEIIGEDIKIYLN